MKFQNLWRSMSIFVRPMKLELFLKDLIMNVYFRNNYYQRLQESNNNE